MPEAPTIIHASIALPSSAATVNGIPSLKTLLDAADLLSFEHPLTCVLHLRHAGDIEYVDENDLLGIELTEFGDSHIWELGRKGSGMSRPEQKRLRKEYARLFPKSSVFGKLKKAFSREENRRAEERSGADQHQHVIPLDKITLAKELGRGEFGTVHMAYWNEGGGATTGERGGKEGELKVAVKCISSEKLLNNPTSFLSEAAIMHRMHHDDVVRLYGVVLDTKQIMMVSELASSGSLHSCLLNPSLRDSFPVQVLCAFAIQIARGMAYLEAQRLIHRDLAARNVLVFSATKVKISDFGLSRSLGVGEDYYRGEFSPTLRLPIAWCAPECINFLKFTHSSDVWAYGVTLWEMFAYGRMPWEGKNGAEILEAIDKQRRHLARPRLCPEDMYALMGECWAHDAGARPTFAALLAQLPDRLPLHVRAVVTMSSAPSADHLVYNRDDLIYVIDKNPEECPDGSYWLGSLKNGRTGLFLPKDTVAHLGAEPPATNRGETEEKKKEEKEKKEKKSKEKENTREKMKALIGEPQAVRHTAHLGVDGAYFGLLQEDPDDTVSRCIDHATSATIVADQKDDPEEVCKVTGKTVEGHGDTGNDGKMDKKDLLSSSISPSGGASRSERGEMSPSSLHSSHSSGSSQSIAVPSTSSSSFPNCHHHSSSLPLSPPHSRAPSQRNGHTNNNNSSNGVMSTSVHSSCSSNGSTTPAPTLPPRISASAPSRPSPGGHIGAPLAQREPSAPPLTSIRVDVRVQYDSIIDSFFSQPDLSGSDTWSSSDGGCTTSTSVDTVIGVARADMVIGVVRGLGGGNVLRPGGPPVCAVYARGTSNGIDGISSSLHHADSSPSCSPSSDPLLDRLEAVQRDLTDFSIASMCSSTAGDTVPLLGERGGRDPMRHNGLGSIAWNGEKTAVRLMTDDEMDRLKEKQRKEHRKVDKELSDRQAKSCVLPSAPPLQQYSSIRKTNSKSRLEDSWTPEAQEAYRLFVECGVNLREASTSPQPSPARSNGGSVSPRPPSLPPRFTAVDAATVAPPARPPKTRKVVQIDL
ncbi:ark-1 [Pristionchus pacificus]|uniref:non-specific protein-tyrosine kinase n=1 Tax=Pristionchus pacificus TaxID=54126 RepID=A0A2A6BWM3_PRIPA|nr:ark-1 [Pristionchus pacificus]|eukprot:PDM70310.1 ark-1 [Pristionchus pacificus]